jgi:fatty acid desaturase
MKILSLTYMLALPVYCQGLFFGLFLFLLGHLVCGEMLATMFIVNHVIEGVAFAKERTEQTSNNTVQTLNNTVQTLKTVPTSKTVQTLKTVEALKTVGTGPMDVLLGKSCGLFLGGVPSNDWAAVQCQTSVNWSSGSWFWNHFSGGLNHQIEHHLFPSLCHTNYVHIQDVVEKTCLEYNVPYRSERNLWTAYWKMIDHLWTMGHCDSHETWYVPELH